MYVELACQHCHQLFLQNISLDLITHSEQGIHHNLTVLIAISPQKVNTASSTFNIPTSSFGCIL